MKLERKACWKEYSTIQGKNISPIAKNRGEALKDTNAVIYSVIASAARKRHERWLYVGLDASTN